MNTKWCEEKNVHLGLVSENFPKRFRCLKCKKRFLTFVRECMDLGCYHVYLPKHKIRKRKKGLQS